MKNIYKYMVIALVLCLSSCQKDKMPQEEPYLYFDQEIEMISFGTNGGSKTIEMYSNQGPWVIEPAYNGDKDWIDIWPNEGNNDGRFKVTVSKNEGADNRMTQINVVIGSKVVKSINLYQLGTTPSILLDMGSARLTAPAHGGEIEVGIISNSVWKAVISEDGAEWISLGEQTENAQKFIIKENKGDERSAKVRFQVVGTGNEKVYVDFTIAQFDSVHDPYNGTKVTIKDLYERFPNGTSAIAENLWCEGTVISDLDMMNFNPLHLFVQDESGRGMRFEFNTAKENNFKIGERVKIHLYGLEVARDTDTGAISVTGTTSTTIFERRPATAEQQIEPIEVADLTKLDGLVNTLVKVKDVSFILPYGTYMNVDNRYYGYEAMTPSGHYNPSTQFYCDGNDFAGQTFIDTKDNIGWVYVRSSFLDRHACIIPKGSGDITGIVQKYYKSGLINNILLIRSNEDNQVSDNASDSHYNTLVQFGPFEENGEKDKVLAYVGTAQLKHSVFTNVVPMGSAGGVAMDWGWTYMRKAPAKVTVGANGVQTVSPIIPNNNAGNLIVTYTCIAGQKFWNATGSTINRSGAGSGDLGEAWIFNVENFNAIPGKPIWLTFTSSSSQTGPMYFDIEWSENENDPISSYRKIGELINPDWYTSHQLEQFRYRLPDELIGKTKFTIRFRVSRNVRAGNGMTNGVESGTTIASGGSPRIGIWAIQQTK